MTTTWSPLFMCGVKVGLCLPRSTFATPDARRPRTWSVASTTNQSLFKSAAFAVHVFCLLIFWFSGYLVNHFHQGQAPGGARARRGAAVFCVEDLSDPLGVLPAPADLGQRSRDPSRESSEESLGDQLQLDHVSVPFNAR